MKNSTTGGFMLKKMTKGEFHMIFFVLDLFDLRTRVVFLKKYEVHN